MLATARAGSDQGHGAGIASESPMVKAGTLSLEPSLAASQGVHKQEAGIRGRARTETQSFQHGKLLSQLPS